MYVVMCDNSDVVVCFEEHVESNKKAGMWVYGRARTEESAQVLVKRCEMGA